MADSSASRAADEPQDAGSPDPETVTPVVPRHQKSYTEVMEMTLRGERRVVIQDINDEPPNSDQPISEPCMAPKPKPLERQGCANNFGWDLRTYPSKSTSGVQTGSFNLCKGVENDNPIRPLVTPAATTTLGD